MHLSDDVLVCGDAIQLHLVLLHHLSVELLREARILGRAERHILHVLIDALSLHVNFRLLVHLHLLAVLAHAVLLARGVVDLLVQGFELGAKTGQCGVDIASEEMHRVLLLEKAAVGLTVAA